MKPAIRITITGPRGGGKTKLLQEVLLPALRRASGFSYVSVDAGIELNGGGAGPLVDICVTNDLDEAKRHLAGDSK